jgi:hypothetical protein
VDLPKTGRNELSLRSGVGSVPVRQGATAALSIGTYLSRSPLNELQASDSWNWQQQYVLPYINNVPST